MLSGKYMFKVPVVNMLGWLKVKWYSAEWTVPLPVLNDLLLLYETVILTGFLPKMAAPVRRLPSSSLQPSRQSVHIEAKWHTSYTIKTRLEGISYCLVKTLQTEAIPSADNSFREEMMYHHVVSWVFNSVQFHRQLLVVHSETSFYLNCCHLHQSSVLNDISR